MSHILTAGVVRAVTQAASSAKPARAVAARAHGEPTRFAINRRQPDPDHTELRREHKHATQKKEEQETDKGDDDKGDDDDDDGTKDAAGNDNGDDDDDDHDERAKSIKWFEVGGGTETTHNQCFQSVANMILLQLKTFKFDFDTILFSV